MRSNSLADWPCFRLLRFLFTCYCLSVLVSLPTVWLFWILEVYDKKFFLLFIKVFSLFLTHIKWNWTDFSTKFCQNFLRSTEPKLSEDFNKWRGLFLSVYLFVCYFSLFFPLYLSVRVNFSWVLIIVNLSSFDSSNLTEEKSHGSNETSRVMLLVLTACWNRTWKVSNNNAVICIILWRSGLKKYFR
jgi:hypothetical protein